MRLFCSVGLLVLMLVTLACSEKNADAPYYNKVHAEAWLDPNYINIKLFHGFQAETQTLEACMKCHEIYSEGQGNIPGCLHAISVQRAAVFLRVALGTRP